MSLLQVIISNDAVRHIGLRLIYRYSLAFLHCVRTTLHPRPFVCDIAIFVLKRDVKLQLTNYLYDHWSVITTSLS